jgi:hypothetical protein
LVQNSSSIPLLHGTINNNVSELGGVHLVFDMLMTQFVLQEHRKNYSKHLIGVMLYCFRALMLWWCYSLRPFSLFLSFYLAVVIGHLDLFCPAHHHYKLKYYLIDYIIWSVLWWDFSPKRCSSPSNRKIVSNRSRYT